MEIGKVIKIREKERKNEKENKKGRTKDKNTGVKKEEIKKRKSYRE